MPSSSIALLFSVAFGLTNALPWAGAQETDVYQVDEFSPKPTGVPADPARLFKRSSVDVNVCGWVGGDSASVARCGAGSSCIHDTIHGYIGCCATSGPCTDGVYTSCVDKSSDSWSSVQGLINNGVLTCSESSACYRNTFPGNYMQYNCGEASMAADVQTTFAGQPKDLRLQVVYTGVNFSPMSAKPSTTSSVPAKVSSQGASSTDNSETPSAGKADPSATETSGPTGTSEATEDGDNYKEKTGAIAGGTVGGLAALVGAVALVLFCLRRRQKKKQLRVGGFVSLHQKSQPTSGPFQRIRPYSPEDYAASNASTNHEVYMSSPHQDVNDTTYISPFTGHPDQSHQPIPDNTNRDLLGSNSPPMPATSPTGSTFAHSYETAVAIPISRLNKNSPQQIQSQFTIPPGQEQSLSLMRNSEIDDFSRNWHNAIVNQGYAPEGYLQDRDTHIHEGDMPDHSGDVGLAGAVRRAASTLSGNSRTIDPNVRSEGMRQVDAENTAWSAQQLRAAQLADVGMGMGQRMSTADDGSPPRSPLREQMMQAFNAATRVGGDAPPTPVRYALVDDAPPVGDNVPVLQGPGQMKMHRPRKSE